ncbi:MAG: S8/S53 family peptidase, partial [Bacteroidota bacterium]
EILSHLNGNTGDNNKIELQNIEVYPVKKRPVLYLRIDDYNLIASLRRNEIVSFIEPAGYSFGSEQVSASKTSIWPGCGDKPVTQFYPGQKLALPTNDYYSWHMGLSNIPEAWEHSMPNNLNQKVTGKGIKVGVIDTGISSDQYYLNAGFQNNVSGRTLSKINNFSIQVGGNEDNCGHGTRMSALVAAPRTNKLTGVAYESSLVMYKAVYNVYIGFGLGEVSAVANALTTAAGDPSVKILSMSIGKVTADTDISIAILQCTLNGKLIFCAAGTNNNSNIAKNIVVFPAILPYTIAVTGLTTASPYEECISCHFGSSVDFSLEIEDQYNSSKAAVTLGRESNSINEYNYSNGASTATATMAGIAALVWSVNPSMTASQVKNILKESSELYGSSKHNKFGWGPVDAAVAVEKAGALPPGYVPPLIASISGPSTFNPASTYNFYSSVPNANAPLIRKWYLNGQFLGTGSFMAIPFIANQTPVSSTITLEVEEVGGDNRTAVATKSVTFLSGSNNSNVESE